MLANLAIGVAWAEHVLGFRSNARDLISVIRDARPAGLGVCVIADSRFRGDVQALDHVQDLATAYAGLPVQTEWYDLSWPHVTRGAGIPTGLPTLKSHFESMDELAPYRGSYGWLLLHASLPADQRALAERLAIRTERRGDWTLCVMSGR